MNWQVHAAKAHFSELVERAQTDGPQTITRHGSERAVLISAAEYHALLAGQRNFKAHLFSGPKFDAFECERDPDTGRHVEL